MQFLLRNSKDGRKGRGTHYPASSIKNVKIFPNSFYSTTLLKGYQAASGFIKIQK
jgi:hypothetical protein